MNPRRGARGAFALLIVGAGPAGAAVVRAPYVEAVTRTSAYVCWRSAKPDLARLEYGPEGEDVRTASDSARSRDHCLRLADLEPSKRYRYRVTGSAEASSWRWFRSAEREGEGRLHFAVFGDSGDGGENQRKVGQRLKAASPEFILHVGDVVYPGGDDRDYDAKYFVPYAGLIDRTPIYFVPGNHDYGQKRADAAAGAKVLRENYLTVHRFPAPAIARADDDLPTYYSFDRGDAHFAALDANRSYPIAAAPALDAGSAQRAWLESDLAASKARWKFVFMHEPVYTTGERGGMPGFDTTLGPVFEKYGVDVVFQGHVHDYERTLPIREGRAAKRGVVYFEAGDGGAELNEQGLRAGWSASFEKRFGFLDVHLRGDRLVIDAIGVDGRPFDHWETIKSVDPKR